MSSLSWLPPELIAHIFSFLDSSAPSDVRLRDQPSPSLLSSPDTPLKTVSRVCKQWRALALPLLFRHVLWSFDLQHLFFPRPATLDIFGKPATLPLVAFVRDNNLGRRVETLTLIVSDVLYEQIRLAGAGNASNATAGESSRNAGLEEDLRSFLHTDVRARARWTPRGRRRTIRPEDWNWLWRLLFSAMDPKRLTVLGMPQVLAKLLSRTLFLGDAWSFPDQHHILSLERDASCGDRLDSKDGPVQNATDSPNPSEEREDPAESVKTILFTIRPWTSLLLNEGSSIRVYKTYEFFLKRPPSILGPLLGCEEAPNDEPLIPSSVRSLSYIAMFPLSSHFNSLVNHLPRLDKLFLQLVPRNDVLDDRDEMRNIEVGDLWMERNSCYSLVLRALFGVEFGHLWDDDDLAEAPGWRSLKVFESGDAADKEAWDMAVEYVRSSGTSWTVVADGVLVKRDKRTGDENDSSVDESDTAAGGQSPDGNSDDDPSAGFELLSVTPPW